MVDSSSSEKADLPDVMSEIIARADRISDAKDVVRDLSQTFINNGMDVVDVAGVLEDVAKSLKHYS